MKRLMLLLLILACTFLNTSFARADADEPESGTAPPTLPNWTQLSPTSNVPPRTDVAMAYDTARGVTVMFGGFTREGDYLDETWEFDSETLQWAQRFPSHRPPPRYGAALAYDAARGVTVLFGGWSAFTFEMNDTWLWDGNDWIQVFPTDSPGPRRFHSMVYDRQRQIVVLFGGNRSYEDSVTWEWDGMNWSIPNITQPSWRYGSALVYDTRRNTTVVFGGGRTVQPYFYDETWERTGIGDWMRRFPQNHPSARERAAFAYFPKYRSAIIYGGIIAPNDITDETWAWTGQRWFKLPLDPHPTGGCAMMIYDPVLRSLLLYLGCSAPGVVTSETWLLR